ncbi:MAG: FkbM family methyltransferase [Sulfuritalea sp.]|nr:FkbM family methyltransferase [Sulfuritalea sp.]MDP1984344.1 FkbM family methyltransferase [Sulfuritalea sp.]
MWNFFQFLDDECTLTILDIGAAIVDVPSYQHLVDAKRARLIGFEPDIKECQRLNDSYGPPHQFFPYFIGDGRPAVFHETNWGPTGSLFEPNTPLLQMFHRLGELVVPVAQHPVNTTRLDDIAEVAGADFIKIDCQGSELAVFQNASRVLADAVLIQTEVSFVEIYKGQPMFSDVDAYLRRNGFQFHDIVGIGDRPFKPLLNPHNPSPNPMLRTFHQRLWADVYYVKDWLHLDSLPAPKLRKMAALLHDIVGSYDLAYLALRAMDNQLGTDIAGRYLNRLQRDGLGSIDTIGDSHPPSRRGGVSVANPKRVLNVGGNSREIPLPAEYDGWDKVLLDIDQRCNPDVLCDARELGRLPCGTFDSVYCSHNLEHYYQHDVARVLAGFQHVLEDHGFAFVRVPDMAALMQTVVERQLDITDILYQSDAGPIAVRDVIYGYGREIETSGNDFFAHKTGFTEKSLVEVLHAAGFPQVFTRDGFFEIAAFAFKTEPSKEAIDHLNLSGLRLSQVAGFAEHAEGAGGSATAAQVPVATAASAERPPISLTTTDGLSISVPGKLACISTYVLLEQERWFEKEVDFLGRWLRPGMNVIDIGANVGVYSLPIARAVGNSGRVFAFEPGAGARRHLEASRLRNGMDNLQILPCALSDSEKEGWLQEGTSSELNSLGAGRPAAGNGERVRVSTLDIQERECQWPSIDFIKIDAEGQEERIVAGGRAFFSGGSPLVMYEVKHGSGQTSATRWILEALGYRTYRLLGDATCLVPVASDEQFDLFELNLFAAKPDRAARLAESGFLVEKPVAHALTSAQRAVALEYALSRPYARAFEFSLDDISQCPFGEAFVAYAAYRHAGLDCARRHAALKTAFELLDDYCRKSGTPSALATLARVALDIGHRGIAVATLEKLVSTSGVELDQPFFPPGERYEDLSPEGRESEWFVAAANEQFELARSHSSYFQTGALDRLKWLCESPFSSAAINRRLILEGAKRGQELSDLVSYLNPGHSPQNPAYWTATGLPEILQLC